MRTSAGSSFAADAAIYDRSRRQLVPCFDDFYGVAVALSPFERDAPIRVLDLGAGTGLMSAFFAEAHPHARFTLVDAAGEMLDHARARFAGDAGRFSYVTLDYAVELPRRMFDLVVSALSIHHLPDGDKAALFRRAYAALQPGGAFVNADQVLGRTPATDARNHAAWLAGARSLGVSQEDLDAARERMKHDCAATLADQLRWMDEAGFRDVDCSYTHHMFAVYSGRK